MSGNGLCLKGVMNGGVLSKGVLSGGGFVRTPFTLCAPDNSLSFSFSFSFYLSLSLSLSLSLCVKFPISNWL